MLSETYTNDIRPKLVHKFRLASSMAAPKLTKIVINVGLGEALRDKKAIASASEQLKVITVQKPQETRAKRAISTYKLRAGDVIGLKVTLRGQRMFDFLTRLRYFWCSLTVPNRRWNISARTRSLRIAS